MWTGGSGGTVELNMEWWVGRDNQTECGKVVRVGWSYIEKTGGLCGQGGCVGRWVVWAGGLCGQGGCVGRGVGLEIIIS